MYKFKQNTLIDYIFLSEFLQLDKTSSYNKINIDCSYLINEDELKIFKKKIMYKACLYKKEAFYILTEHIDNIMNDETIQSIFQPIMSYVKEFYYDVSLKNLDFSVSEHKIVDFTTLQKKGKALYGYVINGSVQTNENTKLNFIFFIPVKLLKFLIFFLTNKDISKFKDLNTIIKFIEELELEFITAKSFFPFRTREFFNELDAADFQKTISLLLSSNMISYDMLYALSRVIESGTDRILHSLSKNLKEEFIQNVQEKANSYDKRWVEASNYHLLCNIKILLEKKKFDSPILSKFKQIIEQIDLKITEKIFNKKPLLDWMKEALKQKKLHSIFSACNLKNIATALSSESDEILSIFKQGISTRSYEDLLGDIDYIKRNKPSYEEEFIAKQNILYKYAELIYNSLEKKYKNLINWVKFKSIRDLNQAYNYIGPVVFSLGIMILEEKVKRFLIRNLNPPSKYFVEDLLTGTIKLNFPYGRATIQKSAEELAKELHKLNFVGRINIVAFENIKKENN